MAFEYIVIWYWSYLWNISKKQLVHNRVLRVVFFKEIVFMNTVLGIYLRRVPNILGFPIMQGILNYLYGKRIRASW